VFIACLVGAIVLLLVCHGHEWASAAVVVSSSLSFVLYIWLILSVQFNQFVQSKTQIVQSNTRNCAVQKLQDSCRQTETA